MACFTNGPRERNRLPPVPIEGTELPVYRGGSWEQLVSETMARRFVPRTHGLTPLLTHSLAFALRDLHFPLPVTSTSMATSMATIFSSGNEIRALEIYWIGKPITVPTHLSLPALACQSLQPGCCWRPSQRQAISLGGEQLAHLNLIERSHRFGDILHNPPCESTRRDQP